jgi:predicted Zn finger-like uncharacterized protein
MPIPVNCPNCGTALKAPDSAAGRTVKCPRCSTPFAVPAGGEPPFGAVSSAPPPARAAAQPPGYDNPDAYDSYPDEDRGYRRPPPRPSGGTGVQLGLGIASLSVGAAGLVIGMIPCIGFFPGLVAGGIGLVLGIVGLIVALTQQGRGVAFPIAGAATSVVALLVTVFWYYWVIRSVTNTIDNAGRQVQQQIQWAQDMARRQQNKAPFPNPNFNPAALPPVQEGGQLQLKGGSAYVTGHLGQADPRDKLRPFPCKIYTVNLEAGRTYQIDMASEDMDSFLRLENPNGQQVAADDDGGGFPNARISFPCQQAGMYRISCTTFRGGIGTFTLKVEQK